MSWLFFVFESWFFFSVYWLTLVERCVQHGMASSDSALFHDISGVLCAAWLLQIARNFDDISAVLCAVWNVRLRSSAVV